MDTKIENLGGIFVFCSDTHRFGTDAVMLEYFADVSRAKNACDMGTGCGIIAMLMLRDNALLNVTAIDIQPEAIELVNMAATHNKCENRLNPLLCDIRKLDKTLHGKFDLVTMNPPYKKAGAGLMTDNDGLNIARFELKCTFDDAAAAAAKLLKPSGRFCVCHRPERLCDIFCDMRAHGIEPKTFREVYQKSGSAPMLVLVEGIYKSKSALKILPPLYLEDENGNMTAEVEDIYKPWLYERKKNIE